MRTTVLVLSTFITLTLPNIVRADDDASGLVIDVQSPSVATTSDITLSATAWRLRSQWLGGFVNAVGSRNGYAEAYAGPAVAPTQWLLVGAGVGFEQTGEVRYGTVAYAGTTRLSLLNFIEFGGSGFWFRSELNFRPISRLPIGYGFLADALAGLGPRLEFSDFKVMPFQVWFASLVSWDKDAHLNWLVGLRAIL